MCQNCLHIFLVRKFGRVRELLINSEKASTSPVFEKKCREIFFNYGFQ